MGALLRLESSERDEERKEEEEREEEVRDVRPLVGEIAWPSAACPSHRGRPSSSAPAGRRAGCRRAPTTPTTIQSNRPSWKNQRSPPPIVSPAATWSQKPNGLDGPSSTAMAARRKTSPTAIVTIADQSPPPEMRSVTKNQLEAASSNTSSGNSKSRSATTEATMATSSSTSSQKRKPSKTPPSSVSGSQPNHSRIEPKNTTNATTPLVASNPAVTK